jgi:hypothetical protein
LQIKYAADLEREEHLLKEQEAAITARPPSATKEDLGHLKGLPQMKNRKATARAG